MWKKVRSFCRYFFLYFVGACIPPWTFYLFFDLIMAGYGALLYVRPVGTPLEGVYLDYMGCFFAGSVTTIGLGGLCYSLYFLFRSFRYAQFKYKSAKLAAAPADQKEA